ncbi:MAG: HAD family hydrolase [Erysipelotrichaceae bacterium]|nr:HAD family hydrolase [Erysipelotrichaceae bacterium]
MKNTKLIVGDLDGTLIVKHNMLSKRNRDIIIKAREKGIYFGIASGRPLDELHFYKDWGLDEDFDVVIGLNGCQLKDNVLNTEENYFIMKKEWIKLALDVMKPFKYNPVMYIGNKMLTNEITELVIKSASSSKKEIIVAKDESEFYKEDNFKIMFRVSEEDMPMIEKEIYNMDLGPIRAFKTQSTLLEFSSKEVDKSFTLQKFCEHHNISVNDVVAFGDTTNDNGMLEWAGVGVCMENGSDDTKEIADYICKSVEEDGVAQFIEDYIF